MRRGSSGSASGTSQAALFAYCCPHTEGVRVERIIPDLVVDDIEADREFYGGYLGLEKQDLGLGWVTRYVSPAGAEVQPVAATLPCRGFH